MATKDELKTIGEVIDRVERLREELLTVQTALERMESRNHAKSETRTSGRTRYLHLAESVTQHTLKIEFLQSKAERHR